MIYLDNASTTKIDEDVLNEMLPYLKEHYGNPGSIHSVGFQAKEALDKARKQAADFIGTSPDRIIFTSSGSEANNLALHAALQYAARSVMRMEPKIRVIASAVEHHSIMAALQDMEESGTIHVDYVYPDCTGVIRAESIREKISYDTGLVCCMYANNETGAVNEVEEIGRICKEYGVFFFTDCVQAAGILDIDVNRLQCDFATISSHKIHGPKGVGALYCGGKYFTPLIFGGGDQEFGLRGGTENIPGIVGFGAALEASKVLKTQIIAKISLMKTLFYKSLMSALKKAGIDHIAHVNSDSVNRIGKVISITFDGVDAESLVLAMSVAGVCISAGSACNSRESIPSYVLTAQGLTPEEARSTVRISFSKMNTFDEVKKAGRILAETVNTLLGYNLCTTDL